MNPYRLPKSVVPSRYAIEIAPNLGAAVFSGKVSIEIDLKEKTREILLNARDLRFRHIELVRGAESLVGTAVVKAEEERALFTFGEAIAPGKAILHIEYDGELKDRLHGFYRSRYRRADGSEALMASTHFEATDARCAFPCWDEPEFKATFQVTLRIPEELTGLANTKLVREERVDGMRTLIFAESMVMSTYLVAFAVGELVPSEVRNVGNTELRIYTVPGKERLVHWALDIAAFSLSFFEEYYGTSYPGDKLDLISIPEFEVGAMENLGAITFRETSLLVDVSQATHSELERVADVVAHENAHMWFGDLVTMAWWNGLWLNEAFATFMEILAVDAWKPEWKKWEGFAVSRTAAFWVDGLRSTRSIEFPVEAPSDADAMFDVLTYIKGAAVLRMLEQFLGEGVFKRGIQLYLERFAFKNAETHDLWSALGEASGKPVGEWMQSWVFAPGFPLVEARYDTIQHAIELRQRRFLYLDGKIAPATRWAVPVHVRLLTPGGAEQKKLLLADECSSIPLPKNFEAVVVNDGSPGFYRVLYDKALSERLVKHGWDRISALEKFQWVSDSWAATLSGGQPLSRYLDSLRPCEQETDGNLWAIILASFRSIRRAVRSENREAFHGLVRKTLARVIDYYGWEPGANESELSRQTRGDLLVALGTLGRDTAAFQRAAELYRSADKALDANIRAALIPILASQGGEEWYEEFWKRYRAAESPQDEQRFLYALPHFESEVLAKRTLGSTLDGSIRTQDAPFVVRALLLNVSIQEMVWRFVEGHWREMGEKYPKSGLRRLFEGMIAFSTEEAQERITAFFKKESIDLGGKSLEQYLEQLDIAVRFAKREKSTLASL